VLWSTNLCEFHWSVELNTIDIDSKFCYLWLTKSMKSYVTKENV